MSTRDFLKGKRIAVVGLGPSGEMVADVKYLIKAGALVGVYDLRSEARLKSHLVLLRSIGLANYVCGSIPADDLIDNDIIILSHEYPRDSSFLKAAKEKGIPIEYQETFFLKHAPPVTLIGIMGMCGKATVVSMLEPMLKKACAAYDGQGFFTVDPESGDGIVAHLKKIKSGDIVLMRVIEPMMAELREMHISPHVSVFTTVPGKGAYTESPFEILANQTYNNYIVASDEIIDMTHSLKVQPRAKMLRTRASYVPAEWQFKMSGPHDRENAALALQTARLFKVDDEMAEEALIKWKPLKGRLEFVKKVRNVEFYNDTASVMSCSTQIAVESLAVDRNLVLVMGGAENGCDYRTLLASMPKYVHTLVLLPGSGTMKERKDIVNVDNIQLFSAPSIEEAARISLEHARKGDRVLFSPGFEAAGVDSSRKDRGERFVKAVRAL